MLWGQNVPLSTRCFLTGKHGMLARLFSPETSGVPSFIGIMLQSGRVSGNLAAREESELLDLIRCDLWQTVACELLPSSFTAGCFQLNSCTLESVQWFWPSSAPEVLQKKPGPLYSNFKPFFWCCPLFVDLPSSYSGVPVCYSIKKKKKKIFRMCCLIAAPYNPSCTPGDVYLVFLSLLHGKKRKGKLSYERGLQW